MLPRNIRDTVLLSGWLFSDLLLGLMMIFLVSMQPPPPPRMAVAPESLKKGAEQCTKGPVIFQCTVTLQAATQSLGVIHWKASTDISNAANAAGKISFSPAKGDLKPGASVKVAIANIPCQDGSFTFSGQKDVFPVTVSWLCTPTPERLDFTYIPFTLQVQDIQALLTDDTNAVADIKRQVMEQPVLSGRSVGLVIVYGGVPDPTSFASRDQGQAIAEKIYTILGDLAREGFAPLKRASHYDPLLQLYGNANTVTIQVYLFK